VSQGNSLERLNAVQVLDIELDRLQQQEASIPDDLRDSRAEKERLETALTTTRESHAAVRRKVNEADLELRDLTAKREKARTDQRAATSAKEQSQYENLIQQLSGRIDELEGDSLPLVERMEKLDAEVKSLEAELRALEPKLAELEGMDEARINALRTDHDEKMIARNALAEEIDFKILREYDSVRKARKGIGIVTINAGKCGGCKMQLPMNIVQRVRSGTAIVKCPSCGRILWMGE
jgi:uncharacterized protein